MAPPLKPLQAWFAEEKHWTKRRYRSEKTGAMCLIGAMRHFYGRDTREYFAGIDRLLAATGAGMLHTWNDKRERTIEDIRRVVKEADV